MGRSSLASSEELSCCFNSFLFVVVVKLSELTGARRQPVPPFFFYFEGQVAVRFSSNSSFNCRRLQLEKLSEFWQDLPVKPTSTIYFILYIVRGATLG